MNSIRQRLLFWQIAALLFTAALISFLTYELALRGFWEVRDYGLQQIAYSVVRHDIRPNATELDTPQQEGDQSSKAELSSGPESTQAEAPNEQDNDADQGQFISQIWNVDGKLEYSSDEDGGPPLQAEGLHRVRWNGEDWHVYALKDKSQVVQISISSADRASSFAELVPWLLLPLCVLLLLMGALIHTAVTGALAPLERLQKDIGDREVEELHAVETGDLPDELCPLGKALNHLLARVDALLQGQRVFLADVAHELNTPLAAVKLQAQLARRSDGQEHQLALDELDQGIARATHLVAQLLQMARLDPGARERQSLPVRLDTLAARSVAAHSAQSDTRDIDLGLVPSEAATVLGDPADLRVLIDNLVDNALRHTPSGSQVDVQVGLHDGFAELTVRDNGPGIPPEARSHVLERFVRLNPQDATGSGLGLAIVAQIVEQHQGRLALEDSPGGGLSVRVSLPVIAPHDT